MSLTLLNNLWTNIILPHHDDTNNTTTFPDHNSSHAADVAQTVHRFSVETTLAAGSEPFEIAIALIAALAHDVGHPGTTNAFQVNAKAPIALVHNDLSVLENFHAVTLFEILKIEQFDICSNFDKIEYRFFRHNTIEMILGTDLTHMHDHLSTFCKWSKEQREKTSGDKEVLLVRGDRMRLFSMALKCADVGHPGYDRDLHVRWSLKVMEEFVEQGEKETALGLPASMKVDNTPIGIAKSNAFFLSFFCLPLYTAWSEYWGEVGTPWKENIEANLRYWNQVKETGVGGVTLQGGKMKTKFVKTLSGKATPTPGMANGDGNDNTPTQHPPRHHGEIADAESEELKASFEEHRRGSIIFTKTQTEQTRSQRDVLEARALDARVLEDEEDEEVVVIA
jgi:hypothetical protein